MNSTADTNIKYYRITHSSTFEDICFITQKQFHFQKMYIYSPVLNRGDLKNVLGQKWQPVITNYGWPRQSLNVEKPQHNFLCSLHQTPLCIHFIVPLHWHVVFRLFYWTKKISLHIILTSNVKINRTCMRHSKCNIQMI